MPELIEILTPSDIETKVSGMALSISKDYANGNLVLVGVLKGAFMLLADLARQLTVPSQIGFVGVSSYGSDMISSGRIIVTKELDIDIEGKDVIIVEDIVDTGLTLQFIVNYLQSFNPGTLRICSLIDKRERRKVNVVVDYACHEVSEGFLVGYGLDHAENYRHLPAIYHLKL
ncbi:MAG: hypoxanthine phosphoribosyltransferase [Proteobacteria bacterium]|nr:hypoxanthine phosphoribosyltransferase [Pseudomonadota bacterium]